MADYYQLALEKRETSGSALARSLRKTGKIPANYYYKEHDNINLVIDSKDLYHALHSGQRIFEVELNGDIQYVMIKEMQYHPVTDNVMHVDLMRVRRDVKMTISVSVHLEGEAVGVKEGGVLSQVLTGIDIECLPFDVPEFISLDITNMELNSSLTVADIVVGDDISVLTAEDQVIATITLPKEEEPEVELEEKLEEGEEKEAEAEVSDEESDKKSKESSSTEENAE